MSYKLDLRKSVADLVGKMSSNEIIKMFKDKPISRATIFRVIKDCREGKQQENKTKPGRPPKLSAKATKNLLATAKNSVGHSTRRLARKLGISNTTVHRILVKNNMTYRKCNQEPKYTTQQLECFRALRDKYFANDRSIIMDHDFHFSLSNYDTNPNEGYYTDELTPDNVRHADEAKFEPKVSMWLAISSEGISEPHFRPYGSLLIDSDIYISQHLTKLKRFIESHHYHNEIMFWPDLSSCDYSREILDCFREQNIPFVPKNDNPPNVPQARQVDIFRINLKRMVYENGWEAQTMEQLVERIKQKLQEVDKTVCQRTMQSVQYSLQKIEDNDRQ